MTLTQPNWRFRDDEYGINVDNGWMAALNTAPSSLDMGQQFRIRIEIAETAGSSVTDGYKLQCKVNAGSWADITTQSSNTCTAVIATASDQFTDQDATTNLLSGSSETFEAGEGIADDNQTAEHTLQNEHTEFEWSIMTLKNYTSFNVLSDGDTIYLRVVRDDGTVLDSYTDISYTVNEPDGFIGGTFTESAHSNGPVQDDNGNLYFFGEHTSQVTPTNNNVLCMWKSTDDGVTWDEVDGTNRPTGTQDVESADMQIVGDTIHIAVHRGGNGIRYSSFNMSSASSNPDTWQTTDEVVDSSTPETDQAVALAVLSDGDMWCFYRTTVSSYESIVYKRRTTGTWGSRNTLDSEASTNFTWVACVVGESDLTHVFYQEITNGSGNIYHRSLSSGGTLSGRESISSASGTNNNNSKSIAKPLYWDDAGDEIIFVVYRESDNDAWSRTITNDGTPSSATGPINTYSMARAVGGSNMLSAQLVGDGTGNAWLIYAENVNYYPYLLEYVYGTGWGSDIQLPQYRINFQQIGHYTISNGDEVVGYVIETHPYYTTTSSFGDDGLMWYYDYVLVPGGIASLSGTGSLSAIGDRVVTGAAALSGTGTLSAIGRLPITNIKDRFSDASMGSIWQEGSSDSANDDASVVVTESGGVVTIEPISSAGSHWNGYYSDQLYDLTNSEVYMELVEEVDGPNANAQASFYIQSGNRDNRRHLQFTVTSFYGSNIVVQYRDSTGDWTQVGSSRVWYNNKWVKFKHNGANIEMYTCLDCESWSLWTTISISTVEIDITQLRVGFAAGSWAAITTTIDPIFDNLNSPVVYGVASLSGTGTLNAAGIVGSFPVTDDFEAYTASQVLGGQGFWVADWNTITVVDVSGDNIVQANEVSQEQLATYNVVPPSTDYYAQITCDDDDNGAYIGVAVRASGTTYYVLYGDNTDIALGRLDSGSWTGLVSSASQEGFNPGDVLRLEVWGTGATVYLKCTLNGNQITNMPLVYEDTDASRITTTGYAGVAGYESGTAYADNFKAGLITTGVATLSGTGSLSAIGSVISGFAIVTGVAALTGTGTLSGAGIGIASSAGTMSGTGTLSAIGKQLLWPFSDDFTGSNDDPWAAVKWTTGASP